MISIRDCTDSPSSFYNHDCLLHPLSLALLDSSPKRGAKGGLYGFAQVFIKPRVLAAKPLCDSLRAA